MTYESCLNVAKTLLTAALPEFTTVELVDQAEPLQGPDDYPALWLEAGDAVERREGAPVASSNQPGGYKRRVWPLVAYLWAYELGPNYSGTTFRDYVERTENAFRGVNTRLAGLADTATTFVFTAGEDGGDGIGIQSRMRQFPDGANVTRYAEVRVLIREGVHG